MLQYSHNEFGLSLTAWTPVDWEACDQACRDGSLPATRRQTYWQVGKLAGIGYFFYKDTQHTIELVKIWLSSSGIAWRDISSPPVGGNGSTSL